MKYYIDKTISNLKEICSDCKYYQTSSCDYITCNVGFSLTAINLMDSNKRKVIEGGVALIPKEDMKYYDYRMIARCIASISKMCKQCKELHNENCVISLARKSIEGVILKETICYPGNLLGYIINVAKQNERFANLINEELNLLD